MTKPADKNISVSFAYYAPYETYPNTIHLGNITLPQARKLMNAIERAHPKSDACIKMLSAEMTRTSAYGRRVGPTTNRTGIKLDGMFYLYDVTPIDERHIPCMAHARRIPQNEEDMIRACAYRLRTGKCCDPFVRRTLGRILFPQHYAKQKTK